MSKLKKPEVIIQFDSEEFYRAVVDLILSDNGMGLTATASNKTQTEELLGKIKRGELKPDLAIIDSMLENTHEEGAKIAAALKSVAPDVKIIAYTIIPEQDWADYVAIKSNKDPNHTLIKGLEELYGITIEANKDVSD
jgi:CheY-like chemotaxis protein